MHKLDAIIAKGCQFILWLTMSIIFSILCINTLMRYAFGSGMQWANEVPEMLFPWLVMAGVVLAAVTGSHITTTFFARQNFTSCTTLVERGGVGCRLCVVRHSFIGYFQNAFHRAR